MTDADPTQGIARGERVIETSRLFAATPRQVFNAWTRPDLVREWFAPPGWGLVKYEAAVQPQGPFQYVLHPADGGEVKVSGLYLEVVKDSRLVHQEWYADDTYPDRSGIAEVTTTFVQEGMGTRLTCTTVYPSRAVRDQVIQAGIEEFVEAAYDRLAAFLGRAIAMRSVSRSR